MPRTLVQFTVECMIQSLKKQKNTTQTLNFMWRWCLSPRYSASAHERLKEEIDSDARLHTAEEVGWKNQAIEAELMAISGGAQLKKPPLKLAKNHRRTFPSFRWKIALPHDIIKKFQSNPCFITAKMFMTLEHYFSQAGGNI